MPPDPPATAAVPSPAADVTPYRYAAFISYRHLEPDRSWAKWLHGALEAYRVPRRLVRASGLPSRVGRVFRDEEELPASDNLNTQIESALSQSRHLIVVCSPRTPKSRWVNREVERFREMGRGDRILALLIEGEPAAAFPPALREIRHTVLDRDGGRVDRVEEVEPLAADVRPTRPEGVRYLRRMAKLRVLASMLGVPFDDLRQREQEQRTRRLAYLGGILSILLCVFAGLAFYALRQRNTAVRAQLVAESQRRRAELELAHGTVLQGDLLGSAARWVEARDKYTTADALFRANAFPPLAAELGLWEAARHVDGPLHTLAGHAGGVWAVAVSPDGRQILSGGADREVKLWDLRTGRLVRTFSGHAGTVHAVAFLPDGRRAVSGGDDKTLRLWDLATGAELREFAGHAAAVRALALSADGSRLLSGDGGTNVKLWELDGGGDAVRSFDAGAASTCLAFSADNHLVLCGTADAKVRLFDSTDGQLVRTFEGHMVAPTTVAFLKGGETAFSGGYDNTFRFWDVATGKQVRAFSNTTGRVSGIALEPGGKRVLAGTWGGMLKLFDTTDGREMRTFVGPGASLVRDVALDPDGRTAVSGSTDGTITVWGLAGLPVVRTWNYGAPVTAVGFSSDGLLAFTATAVEMELWDIAAEQSIHKSGLPGDVAITAVLCPDDRRVLAGGLATLTLVDLSGRAAPLRLAGNAGGISSVAVSSDGRMGLSGGDDGILRVWDLVAGAEVRSVPHDGRVSVAAVSGDGRLALTGGLSGLRLWETSGWREVRPIGSVPTGVADAPSAAAFSPDGRLILVGMQAGTLKLFDTASGREAGAFVGGHTGIVGCVSFSPDRLRAVSASDDGTLRLWDVASGRELRVLTGHGQQVRTVAFSPDGRSLLSGDIGGRLKLWSFGSPETGAQLLAGLAMARDRVSRAPQDARAEADRLHALGRWYAWRGLPDWAAAVLEQARAGGAEVSPLLLGRCYWRTNRLAEARRELVLAAKRREAPELYLRTCLDRIEQLAGEQMNPSTGPATEPATESAMEP